MPSPPNPPSGDPAVRREQVVRLLQDGAVTVDPAPSVLAEVGRLQELGVVQATTSNFVQCSDPGDADFALSNHLCRGRIYVPEQLDDESLDDFCCPKCNRAVFPVADEKQRHQELLCRISPNGILAYLKSLLEHANLTTTSVCDGVLRVDLGVLGVFVCVVDVCRDAKFLTPAWAATQPTCYVLVNAKWARRYFADEPPLHYVLLADIICGDIDLVAAVRQAAASLPSVLFQHSIAAGRQSGLAPTYVSLRPPTTNERRFQVALGSRSVWVEGLEVIGCRCTVRLAIFRLLWESFLEDLLRGTIPVEFRTHPLHSIRPLLEAHLHKEYSDETTVRRLINRLQTDLETSVRRELGLPIDREDIVETCIWRRQDSTDYGYRLNPARVVVTTAPYDARN